MAMLVILPAKLIGPRNFQGGVLVLCSELLLSSDLTLTYSEKYLSGGISTPGYARDADQNSRAASAPDRPPELLAPIAICTPDGSRIRVGPEADMTKAATHTEVTRTTNAVLRIGPPFRWWSNVPTLPVEGNESGVAHHTSFPPV
jgi:hypothetical protein